MGGMSLRRDGQAAFDHVSSAERRQADRFWRALVGTRRVRSARMTEAEDAETPAAAARKYVEGVMWLMSNTIRAYQRDDHIKMPERHPNTLEQDLQVMRRWFVNARERVRVDLNNDDALLKELQRIYRIYVYTAIEAFERKLDRPSWKLYNENRKNIDPLAGPPPEVPALDKLVIPKLREAYCLTLANEVEYCGNVIRGKDGTLRVTGPVTNKELASCIERLQLQQGETHVAYYHSHPRISTSRFGPADENLTFSTADKEAAEKEQIVFYVVNRQREVLKYTPKTNPEAIWGIITKIRTIREPGC
jgi:hypothetical protein